MPSLSSKHRKTLAAVFARPTSPSIRFDRVKALVVALGGVVEEREGSRVAFYLTNHSTGVLEYEGQHAPHPGGEMKRYAVRSFSAFLERAGYTPGGPHS